MIGVRKVKKSVSIILSLCLAALLTMPAFASYKGDAVLRFNDEGKFKIMVLADVQDDYPMEEAEIAFINEALDYAQPDLVVFDGDNIVTSDLRAYEQMLNPLVERNVPFTFVFGNHDDECSDLNKEEMLAEYQKFAGCLAFDADPELHGCATHNLPILSSDGSKVAFNLWMFDSGDYALNSYGERVGYDWVRADQIEWYNNVRDAMTEENGGELVPALAFQHIIPEEPTKKVFTEVPFPLGDLTINFDDGTSVLKVPNIHNYSGMLFEASCPGAGNDGQWQAMVDGGDVLGLVVGHDHVNNFIVNVDGIDLIQTPGVTYHSYYNDGYQGARIIELDENNAWNYDTYNLTTAKLALEDGSALPDAGVRTLANYKFSNIFYTVLEFIIDFFRSFVADVLA